MRTLPGKALQNIENQPIIGFMYKTWVLIFSLVVLLPSRWFAGVMPKTTNPILPILPLVALITCGELVLNNPTVSPAGPYCPGSNVTISFTGTNLPDGGTLQVLWGTNSAYNPCAGGGTQIGTIPIDYPCTNCPTIQGIMINACGINEQENEFMLLDSGCGFNVSNLSVDLLPAGSSANDIGNGTSCPFQSPSASVMAA